MMVAPLTPQMNITRAVIIALNTLDVTLLQKNIRLHITQRVDIFQAINGSQAMALSQETLPLYTRYLIDHGRQNHMQIGNGAMLGCLLSHIEIWKTITPGETVGVFEEDAQIDAVSASRLWWFQQDMHGLSWDILKLDSGQLIDSGKSKYVGTGMAATCANGESCLRWGTRGYLLRYNGAQLLLNFASHPVIQVDALISLLATYKSHQFKLYWATADIAQASNWRMSKVWDRCIWQCFMQEWLLSLLGVSSLALALLKFTQFIPKNHPYRWGNVAR